MSDDVRGRWRELDQAATPKPWQVDGPFWWEGGDVNPRCTSLITGNGADRLAVAVQPEPHTRMGIEAQDMAFIAAARSGWPAAEAECEQLRALLRQVRNELNDPQAALWRIAAARNLIDSAGIDLKEHP